MKTAEFLMWLILGAITVALFCGCQSPALQSIDRDYLATYDATSGQGGFKVRWTPAAQPGQGRPSVGVNVDFKAVKEPVRR
jgi:hypothetical protein